MVVQRPFLSACSSQGLLSSTRPLASLYYSATAGCSLWTVAPDMNRFASRQSESNGAPEARAIHCGPPGAEGVCG